MARAKEVLTEDQLLSIAGAEQMALSGDCVYHVGISGGKDSTGLVLYMKHESGIDPNRVFYSFCDTGNEAPETLEYVKMLSETVTPITTLKPVRDFYELALHKGRFPSPKARFCTTELKMEPSRAFMSALSLMTGKAVVSVVGIRASESNSRASMAMYDFSHYYGRVVWRPLINWSLQDVWDIHNRYGIEPNPLYAAGCRRVGCLPCIMSRKEEIRIIANKFPERIEFLKQKEKEHEHTFFAPSKIPLKWRRNGTLFEKNGKQVQLTVIQDIVEWAKSDGYSTMALDFDDLDEPPSCDSNSGLCE